MYLKSDLFVFTHVSPMITTGNLILNIDSNNYITPDQRWQKTTTWMIPTYCTTKRAAKTVGPRTSFSSGSTHRRVYRVISESNYFYGVLTQHTAETELKFLMSFSYKVFQVSIRHFYTMTFAWCFLAWFLDLHRNQNDTFPRRMDFIF